MTINDIQVEFKWEGYAPIWTGVVGPDTSEKRKKNWFLLNNMFEIYVALDSSIWTGVMA